jgi:hypothetical protein
MDVGKGREQERKLRLLCKRSLHSKKPENFSSITYAVKPSCLISRRAAVFLTKYFFE